MNTLSSLLNFIGSKIADMQSPVEFELTRSSSISSGEGYGVYDKVSKIVRINCYFNNGDTGIPATAAIFTIPSEYRPSEDKSGSGMVYTGAATNKLPSGAGIQARATDGAIRQIASNNATRGFGYIEYVLGGGSN